jgi:hypothetical protein
MGEDVVFVVNRGAPVPSEVVTSGGSEDKAVDVEDGSEKKERLPCCDTADVGKVDTSLGLVEA